ncbi:hypothetical protein B0T14DRAFT_203208 [Immersiella caudata]|uniref:Uncharacterized protein n=1 Tax=Immersiella caudata TaxID=314043 RepID=A0AA39WPK6_9PEZI|nr:hypothetical protein B0T14DRAFT_203208 [Immersiella caudata]
MKQRAPGPKMMRAEAEPVNVHRSTPPSFRVPDNTPPKLSPDGRDRSGTSPPWQICCQLPLRWAGSRWTFLSSWASPSSHTILLPVLHHLSLSLFLFRFDSFVTVHISEPVIRKGGLTKHLPQHPRFSASGDDPNSSRPESRRHLQKSRGSGSAIPESQPRYLKTTGALVFDNWFAEVAGRSSLDITDLVLPFGRTPDFFLEVANESAPSSTVGGLALSDFCSPTRNHGAVTAFQGSTTRDNTIDSRFWEVRDRRRTRKCSPVFSLGLAPSFSHSTLRLRLRQHPA